MVAQLYELAPAPAPVAPDLGPALEALAAAAADLALAVAALKTDGPVAPELLMLSERATAAAKAGTHYRMGKLPRRSRLEWA